MLTSRVPLVASSVVPMAMTVVPAAAPEAIVSCTDGAVAFRAPPTATPSVTTCTTSRHTCWNTPLDGCMLAGKEQAHSKFILTMHAASAVRVGPMLYVASTNIGPRRHSESTPAAL